MQHGRKGLVSMRSPTIKDENGNPCTSLQEQQLRRRRYFASVLNIQSQFDHNELEKVKQRPDLFMFIDLKSIRLCTSSSAVGGTSKAWHTSPDHHSYSVLSWGHEPQIRLDNTQLEEIRVDNGADSGRDAAWLQCCSICMQVLSLNGGLSVWRKQRGWELIWCSKSHLN